MGISEREAGLALVVSCPTADLLGLQALLRGQPVALLPVGGAGQLGESAGVSRLLLVEITEQGGPLSSIAWSGTLGTHTPLDPDPEPLLPPSWAARHPDAYRHARQPATSTGPSEAELWDDEDEPTPAQVFLPVTTLEQLPRAAQISCNELVPKQQRGGRTFAPRVPTLVAVPEE